MSPPNILVVVAHQMRWNCIRAAGDPNAKTPTLDALMRHGVYFEQAVASHSRSAPNLASLATGLQPRRLRRRTSGDTFATIWDRLEASGYHTGVVGQLGAALSDSRLDQHYSIEFGPDHGRTDYHRWLDASGSTYPMPDFHGTQRDNIPGLVRSKGCMAWPLRSSEAPAAWVADLGLRFVQAAPEPFFLLVSFPDPHPPYLAPQVWLDQFPRSDIALDPALSFPHPVAHDSPVMTHVDAIGDSDYRRLLAHYHAHLAHMDYHLGRVLATFNARGHTNNVVIFTAQHGETLGGNQSLFSADHSGMDERIRVPLIVSGIAGQRSNVRDPAPVETVDIAATVADVAGTPFQEKIEGISLLERVKTGTAHVRKASCTEIDDGGFVLREYPYKLKQQPNQPPVLYHVANDPKEERNLMGDPKHVQHQVTLTKSLRKIR